MEAGTLEKRTLSLMQMPLSEQEEAILALMKKVNRLEYENEILIDENKRLKWTLQEHD